MLPRKKLIYLGLCVGVLAFLGTLSVGFSKKTIALPAHLEIANTTLTRELGLGGRAALASDAGMLFVFDTPDFYRFWMKDMLFSLDIVWLDQNFQVVSLEEHVAPETFPKVFTPRASALYVLEVPAGFVDAHGISIGTFFEKRKSLDL